MFLSIELCSINIISENITSLINEKCTHVVCLLLVTTIIDKYCYKTPCIFFSHHLKTGVKSNNIFQYKNCLQMCSLTLGSRKII